MLHRLGEASGQPIGLSSLEAGFGFERVAAESPDANHHFEFRETFPDLFAHRSRRCESVRRQGRDADYVAPLGVNQCKQVVEGKPGNRKGQSRKPLLLQKLSQHGGRDLIGAIQRRNTDDPGTWLLFDIRYGHEVFFGCAIGQFILGKLGDHFVDTDKEKLFPDCVNCSFVPVLFGHAQGRDQHRVVQLNQMFTFKKLANNAVCFQLIHRE